MASLDKVKFFLLRFLTADKKIKDKKTSYNMQIASKLMASSNHFCGYLLYVGSHSKMTRRQWKIILGINLLTIFLVLSPFLPGPSFLSKITNLIFSVSQLGGMLGLILIPFGLVWTSSQFSKKRKDKNHKIVLFSILLWTVPVVVFTHSIWIADFLRDFSRTFAINNAEKLTIALEKYKTDNGTYPDNTDELRPDYLNYVPSPWIMGISDYYYERKEDNYNLTFSQNVILGFNFEVVVYDPTNQHKAEGELTTLYETGKKNWKYYIYD